MPTENSISHSEYLESRTRSSVFCWWVAEDYCLKKDPMTSQTVILPIIKGRVSETAWTAPPADANPYMPMARPELPGEFAKLAGQSEDKYLDFFRRYGYLGYHENYDWDELVGAGVQKFHNPRLTGEPFSWVQAHASTVKLAMDLGERVNDELRLLEFMESLQVQDQDTGRKRLFVNYAIRGHTRPVQTEINRTAFPDYQYIALFILAKILGENIAGQQREFLIMPKDDNEGHGLTSVFGQRNLIGSIYWLLADAVSEESIRNCEYCHHPFVATSEKMKYCPRRMGEDGISLCLNRKKQQTWQREHSKPKKRTGRKGK